MNLTMPLPKTERGAIALAMIVLVLLCLCFGGCVNLKEDGHTVASIGSDVDWVDITTPKGGHYRTGKISNSAIYGAVGGAVSKNIMSTGAAVMLHGATQYLK